MTKGCLIPTSNPQGLLCREAARNRRSKGLKEKSAAGLLDIHVVEVRTSRRSWKLLTAADHGHEEIPRQRPKRHVRKRQSFGQRGCVQRRERFQQSWSSFEYHGSGFDSLRCRGRGDP